MKIECHENPSSLRLRILGSASIFCKAQTDTIHTMTLIRGGLISLTLKYMAEVTPTVGTYDLCALHTKCVINVSSDSTRDGIKVCRPATARFELVIGSVKRRIATGAIVDAFGRVVGIVFTGARALSALFAENAELFWVQNSSPLIFASLVGGRHGVGWLFGGSVGAEEGTEKRNGRRSS